jgi:thiamine biosynthesis lipoprotein
MTAVPTESRTMLAQRLEGVKLRPAGEGFWHLEFRALGSECKLFFKADGKNQALDYRRSAFDWLVSFEARFSRFLPDSLISMINANAGQIWTDIDHETETMLSICDHVNFTSQGAFDATSLPLSLLWDWKRKHDTLPSAAEIAEARKHVGWKRIQRATGRVFLPEEGMMLDFGGVGKEFATDVLVNIAESCGIKNIMVNLGGDISVLGQSPEGGGWFIGLEDPLSEGQCHSGISLKSGISVATSGDYRRCFEFEGKTYGHILDCRTGWPVANGTRSVTVVAEKCVIAGIMSTSCMVLGGRAALQMLDSTPRVEGALWHENKFLHTRGFHRLDIPKGWNP